MTRSVALLLLALLPATVRADVGADFLGVRGVPFVVTITVERDYPEYDFLLVNWAGRGAVQRLRLSRAEPAQVLPDGRTGADRVWTVVAVPKALLTPLAGSIPGDCKWFSQQKDNGIVFLGELDFRANYLGFYDDRERVEVTYRVEIGPEGGRLVKVWENAGDPWVKRKWIAAGILLPVGLIGLVLWRIRRRRSLVYTNS